MTSRATPDQPPVADALKAGREALARHVWPEAFELLSTADRESSLSGADLEALAEAAFFAAHADVQVDVQERAYKAHLAEGNPTRAAFMALGVARVLGFAGKHSIASAWARRGQRLLADQPESYAHGYLALVESAGASAGGDIKAALELAERAVQISNRATDADLQASALSALGTLKIATGA